MLNDSLYKLSLHHTGRLSDEDGAMVLAINVARVRLGGDFDRWLEGAIAMNSDNLPALIRNLMDVAIEIHQDNFLDKVHEFVESGRLNEVLAQSEIKPS